MLIKSSEQVPVYAPIIFNNGIKIYYTSDLDGGGSVQYTDFLNYLKLLDKKYEHCLEWCAGHGVIGFSILDANICDKLYLMEKYTPAMYVAQMNITFNSLQSKVRFYNVDKVAELPSDIKFDLVVANPPHCHVSNPTAPNSDRTDVNRINTDLDWQVHQEFFNNITKYLNPNADIILSEIYTETELQETHFVYAKNNNLTFIQSVKAPVLQSFNGGHNGRLCHYKYIV